MAHSNLSSLPSPAFPQDTLSSAERVKLFQRLLNSRDAIAYQVVATVESVVAFAEAQSFEESIADLKKVLAKFEAADLAVNHFYQANREVR